MVLGQSRLMPKRKVVTVTPDDATDDKNAKASQVRYRNDKNGINHTTIGRVKFSAKALKDNLMALLSDIRKAKPSSAKGVYMKKVTLSTTMGPGLVIDHVSLDA